MTQPLPAETKQARVAAQMQERLTVAATKLRQEREAHASTLDACHAWREKYETEQRAHAETRAQLERKHAAPPAVPAATSGASVEPPPTEPNNPPPTP